MSNITSKETEGVSVVSFNGRIVLGFESAAFRECVKSLLSNGGKKIVLNVGGATCEREQSECRTPPVESRWQV
jgi:hypothetical protein